MYSNRKFRPCLSGGLASACLPAPGRFRGIRQVHRSPGHPCGRSLSGLPARGAAERDGSASAVRHAVLENHSQRLRARRPIGLRRGVGQSHQVPIRPGQAHETIGRVRGRAGPVRRIV